MEQRDLRLNPKHCFPYNPKSACTAFQRACNDLGIREVHFHYLRHEVTSCLIGDGFTIEQALLVTGSKERKMLKHYTQ